MHTQLNRFLCHDAETKDEWDECETPLINFRSLLEIKKNNKNTFLNVVGNPAQLLWPIRKRLVTKMESKTLDDYRFAFLMMQQTLTTNWLLDVRYSHLEYISISTIKPALVILSSFLLSPAFSPDSNWEKKSQIEMIHMRWE